MSKKIFILGLLGLVGVLMVSWIGYATWGLNVPSEPTYFSGPKHKGVCWVGSPHPLQGGELEELKKTGATFISQTPFGWQADKSSPEINWEKHSSKMWWGERLEGLESTTKAARKLGIASILKPHLWVRGEWPGAIEMADESAWEEWFSNYSDFILYYASFAQEQNIPILCIGTELEKTSHREKDWRKLIAKIRSVYDGALIYAANFTEYDQVKFWDELDYIGIQAYFPLSDKSLPSLGDLKKGWNRQLPSIDKIQNRFQKPVIFTELGYCNTVDAAVEPWIWPSERKESILSEEVQALCYQAFFETAWEKPWLAGVYFWKWYPQPRDRNPDFTPQHKKAQEVMESYFSAD